MHAAEVAQAVVAFVRGGRVEVVAASSMELEGLRAVAAETSTEVDLGALPAGVGLGVQKGRGVH